MMEKIWQLILDKSEECEENFRMVHLRYDLVSDRPVVLPVPEIDFKFYLNAWEEIQDKRQLVPARLNFVKNGEYTFSPEKLMLWCKYCHGKNLVHSSYFDITQMTFDVFKDLLESEISGCLALNPEIKLARNKHHLEKCLG